jgi:ATP-binding cassette subfamily B (MDR/TAP) protein 10
MILHRLTLLSSFLHRSTRFHHCQLFKLTPNRQFSLTSIRPRGDRPSVLTNNTAKVPKAKLSVNEVGRLLRLAQHEKGRIGGAIILLLVSSSVTMSVPYFLGKIIDMLQTYKHDELRRRLKQMTFILVGIFGIGALANFGRVYLILTTSQRIIKRVREQLFNGILRKEMAFFDKQKTGELVNRLSSDTEVMSNAVTQNISDGLRALTQSIAGVGLMFYISPQLALVGLATVPPLAVGAILFGRFIKGLSRQVQDSLAKATDVAEERFSNIRTGLSDGRKGLYSI